MDVKLETTVREASFRSADEYKIAYRIWTPGAPPKAIMLIVPGFNAHSAYFDWAARELAAIGFVSYGVDLRGRGKSDGERFYVNDFAEYVGDVEGLMAEAKRDYPGLPVFILGHSAGGVVATTFAYKHTAELKGLICESFAFQVPAPDFVLAVLKGISHVAPHAQVLALKNADFSRDPAAVARMDADPLIAHETQPTKTVAQMVMADEALKAAFPDFKLPVFIIHGSADKATKPAGSQYFFDHAGSADKKLTIYEGHFHDLLNDIGREEVMGDIAKWLDERM